MAYDTRQQMWISVDGGWSGWFRTPNRGADMSPQGWATDGTLLNGGGYAHGSWGSHKRYTFEWPPSSLRNEAQFMKSLADGSYGRGLIHFVTPDIVRQNILPARVADPSMAVGNEGSSLIYGMVPQGVPTGSWRVNNLPLTSAYYNLNGSVPAGYRGDEDATFIPIPEGYTLGVIAFYQATGSAGIYATRVEDGWTNGASERIPERANGAEAPVVHVIHRNGAEGVRLWLGRDDMTPSTATVSALYACLIPDTQLYAPVFGAGYGDLPYGVGPYGGPSSFPTLIDGWTGGMGHSGCRFLGKPSYEVNGQFEGEYRVGFAASFIEVGSYS